MADTYIEPVMDRTYADFQRWLTLRDKGVKNMTAEELAEWKRGMKGAYNASDLNRVGENLLHLRDMLTEAGYLGYLPAFNVRTDWTETDVPTAAEFTDYLNAVETVRAALALPQTTPKTPANTGSLDIQGANDIEKILNAIIMHIFRMIAAQFHCGDLYGGEI